MRRARRIRGIALAAAAGLLALALTACTSGVNPRLPQQAQGALPAKTTAQLRSAVSDAVKLADASGAIVGVWAPWAGSWTEATGTTTRGGAKPVTTGMTFRIGQNTVPMTCTVLLELVDEGTVGLDDPASKWLPGLVGVSGVTLRELCQNTSGIGDYASQLQSEFVNNPTRQWPALELASDGIATKGFGGPGETLGMSWTNAILVGMALENATNQSWAQLYEKYVFGRLDMSASKLPANTQLTIPGAHPAGYAAALGQNNQPVCDRVGDVSSLSPSMGWTAAGVVSDLADLKSFSQALATGSLLSAKSAKAQADGLRYGTSWQEYGLGMQTIGPLRGGSGAVPGFLSAMYTDPASGLTIVVALNNSTPGATFAQYLAQRLASIVSKVQPTAKGAKAVASLPWSEQQMAEAMTKAAPCPANDDKAKDDKAKDSKDAGKG